MVTIALFRLIKAVLLILLGIAALELLDARTAAALRSWVAALPYATEHEFIRAALAKITAASTTRKELAAAVAFAYGALFATEGIGLWLEKVWAEYLTIIATTSFIPFELYEVAKRMTALRVLVLLANAAIVVYLIWRVRANRSGGLSSEQRPARPRRGPRRR
jgi:uncharacterized membrane protein (DUF2068 family)